MPSSPTTVSCRRFAGVSQSTSSIATVPDSNDISPNSRSSWSAWIRCAVSANTRIGRSRAIQDRMSTSWVARSMVTPTSRMRAGNGPARRLVIAYTLESQPAPRRRPSSSTAGLNRSTWPTWTGTPFARDASTIRSASETVPARGFSTRTSARAAPGSARTTRSAARAGTSRRERRSARSPAARAPWRTGPGAARAARFVGNREERADSPAVRSCVLMRGRLAAQVHRDPLVALAEDVVPGRGRAVQAMPRRRACLRRAERQAFVLHRPR